MEEMHRIHKDVPFGYWTLWVAPAFRALQRRWARRRDGAPSSRPTIDANSVRGQWV